MWEGRGGDCEMFEAGLMKGIKELSLLSAIMVVAVDIPVNNMSGHLSPLFLACIFCFILLFKILDDSYSNWMG